MQITSDQRYVISGSDDRTVRVWDIRERKQVVSLLGHKTCVVSVAARFDGKYIVSVDQDSIALIWKLPKLLLH